MFFFLQIVFSLILTSKTHFLSCLCWHVLHLAMSFSEFSYINWILFLLKLLLLLLNFSLFLNYFLILFLPWTLALHYIVVRLVFSKITIVNIPLFAIIISNNLLLLICVLFLVPNLQQQPALLLRLYISLFFATIISNNLLLLIFVLYYSKPIAMTCALA